MSVKLVTSLWVSALIRRAELGGAFATVARRGDETAGAVLVKVYDPVSKTASLYAEALVGPKGERRWMQPRPAAPEADLDAYARRQADIDPDIWVIEVEDRRGRTFLTEPVEPSPSALADDIAKGRSP